MSTTREPTRRTRLIATIAVFVVLAVGLFFGVRALVEFASTQTAVGPTPTPTSTGVGFVYTSDAYGYRIQFPAEPTEESRTVTVDGADVPVTSAVWSGGTTSLVSTAAAYPSGALADTTASLRSSLDGLIANTADAQLVSSDPITLAGRPAVAATLAIPSGTLIVVIAIDGDTQYQLVALNVGQSTAQGFFETFELA